MKHRSLGVSIHVCALKRSVLRVNLRVTVLAQHAHASVLNSKTRKNIKTIHMCKITSFRNNKTTCFSTAHFSS